MKYTEVEVDSVAVAIHEACQTTMPGYSDDRWRTAARAALAARDALFETVAERCEARAALRIAETTRDAAQAIATRETERRREVEALLYGPTTTAGDVTLRTEQPIESLGPVPMTEDRVRFLESSWGSTDADRALAYLLRDAVRRGAKLEGT